MCYVQTMVYPKGGPGLISTYSFPSNFISLQDSNYYKPLPKQDSTSHTTACECIRRLSTTYCVGSYFKLL